MLTIASIAVLSVVSFFYSDVLMKVVTAPIQESTSQLYFFTPYEAFLMRLQVAVTTGVDIEDWIAITSGNVSEGDRVVTWGNENIMFPSPIQILGGDEAMEATASAEGAGAGPRPGS